MYDNTSQVSNNPSLICIIAIIIILYRPIFTIREKIIDTIHSVAFIPKHVIINILSFLLYCGCKIV